MNYIDLTLQNIEDKKIKDSFENILKHTENDVIVILGSPGSGKTSILKSFNNKNKELSTFIKVKEFLKFDIPNNEILLLDGLDEYRSLENDKVFVVTELGNKLSKLKYKKVVISCRELDWYGDTDKNSLMSQIQTNVSIYKVCSLSHQEKIELSSLLNISSYESFISKYDEYGFLDNPQLFTMIADIDKKENKSDIKTKKELYSEYIRLSREKNETRNLNKVDDLSEEERFKYAGYLACFYLFSAVESFSEELLDSISLEDTNISKNKLNQVIKTNIFDGDRRFIHRSISEFLAANFLYKFTKNKDENFFEYIKELFIRRNRIPTELRGTYAWICSISMNEKLIRIDPYYQSIYGDNTSFDTTFKKKIINEVEKYSNENPYFYKFNHRMALESFYTKELDDLLIKKFDMANNLNNHYRYYIINIFSSSKEILSSEIIDFLKAKVFEKEIKMYIKPDIIDIFEADLDFLYKVLQEIKKDEIEDKSDDIKDRVLNSLYLTKISSDEIVEYLSLYKSNVVGHCAYLYKTKYKEKFNLVDKIYKHYALNIEKDNDLDFVLDNNHKSFCEDYFLETILKFEEELSSKEIFDILFHFNQYYKAYNTMSYKSFSFDLKEKEKQEKKKIEKLTNELYEYFIDYEIKNNDKRRFLLYDFQKFFNYQIPSERASILFKKINSVEEGEIKKALFISAVYANRDENGAVILDDYVECLAIELNLSEELEKIKNPPKEEWMLEQEEYDKKEKKKKEKILEKNEKFYSELSDEEIKKNFGALEYVSNMLYIRDDDEIKYIDYLTSKTYYRVKNIIENSIYEKLISPEYLTLESLSERGDARYNIDILYYVSMTLNEDFDFESIDNNFIEYLYINALYHEQTGNINKTNFLEIYNEKYTSNAKKILYKYIELIINKNIKSHSLLLLSYITENDEIDRLSDLARIRSTNLDTFIDSFIYVFLQEFNFNISLEDLSKLKKIKGLGDSYKRYIDTLIVFDTEIESEYTISNAISLYMILGYDAKKFFSLNDSLKIKVLYFLMSAFDTEKSIKFKSGIQSNKDLCASFIRDSAFNLKEIHIYTELEQLLENTMWTNRIKNKIRELEQINTDESFSIYGIEKLKESLVLEIKKDEILKLEPAFYGIGLKLKPLVKAIKNIFNS